jgi:ABC-type oligopeptide transport system substrate-binding subunit
MRRTLSLVALAAGCGLLAASALGSVSQAPPANTFRWSLSTDIDYVDPALAYYGPSWALEYATGALLFNYPDAPAPRGSRLIPEVAAGFPTVSRDGRTYTFRLKTTYRFSNGRRVRAAHFVRAFQRARNRRPATPAASFISDVVHFAALGSDRLRIRLRSPAGDILARLAMPFFMATPTNTPDVIDGIEAPVVSAGPYFIREWTKNRRVILERNPFYRGPRPHRVGRIRVDIGLPLETIKLNIDRGRTDAGDIPPAAHAELGDRFGVKRRSPGRYFVNPAATILYLAFNHDRRLFGGPTPLGNIRLKQAINFAIDRRALMNQYGAYAGSVHDQLLPPTIRGFRDVSLYPRRPNLMRARELAGGSLPSNAQGILYCTNRSPAPQVCQLVQASLRAIGLYVDIRPPIRHCFELACGPSRRGEPFDLSLERWHIDYFDPYDFALLVDGSTIRPRNNTNVSYFDSPAYDRRIARARRLTGPARYRAFSALDHDLMRKAAPVAVYGVPNDRHYVSARTGCYHHHPVYGFDFPAICLR